MKKARWKLKPQGATVVVPGVITVCEIDFTDDMVYMSESSVSIEVLKQIVSHYEEAKTAVKSDPSLDDDCPF